MASSWQEYQEEAARFFHDLGLEAVTDFTVQGVRTTHDVDVYVKSHHVGFDVVWIVECKHWTTPVTKMHVLALRAIVADVGADRGILLSESGFQSGAIEAANLTNVHVTSLADLRGTASAEITAMRLKEIFDRIEECRERYWKIPKETRIESGLRPEVGAAGYSSVQVIELSSELIKRAFRGSYPFDIDSVGTTLILEKIYQFSSPYEILSFVEPRIAELEKKLTACETG
ncbi:MAG TPA: restriction endonuclease [Candidatus Angelobacter sp.]|nr:restriction endonuclease [Candidatus Angelobacter sp.]